MNSDELHDYLLGWAKDAVEKHDRLVVLQCLTEVIITQADARTGELFGEILRAESNLVLHLRSKLKLEAAKSKATHGE